MRLWHKDLIPILPKLQLAGQWRECCLIGKLLYSNGTPNHILVNKVTNYPKEHFATYCYMVNWELKKKLYSPSILTEEALTDYLTISIQPYVPEDLLFDGWHNDRYLYQCLTNLEEKYDCGGIPEEEWALIDDFITERL